MTKLPNGDYLTERGSTVRISGTHGGIAEVSFDWVEEAACCDCHVDAYPEDYGDGWYMTWQCEECIGGIAKLRKAAS